MASSRKKFSTEPAAALAESAAAVLDRHVRSGQRVVVALSGGIDSVVLLHALNSILPPRGGSVAALHVHHGLSPNADAWQSFCADLCADWRVDFAAQAVVVAMDSGEGTESAARAARHAVFAAVEADWVALAHHRGDQAETILFNLLRGCGLRGAAAMMEAGPVRLLRPLLHVSRAAIAAYAAANGLKWIVDESNSDTRFSRNYLRHDVMPLLSARFPGTEANLAAAALRFGEAGALLDQLAQIDLAGRPPRFPLPVALLSGLDEMRGRNLLRYLLLQHGVRLPSHERLAEALRQLTEAGLDRHPAIDFGSHRLVRQRGEVTLKSG
jgi:tRNA(Ile)-lysidine synthase